MAVQQRSSLLPQPSTLRFAELIEQRPMLCHSHRAARLALSYGFSVLHWSNIDFPGYRVNVGRKDLHGFPLIGAGLLPAARHSDASESESQFTAKETAKLRRTVVHWFSSPQQFREFLLLVGGGLTTLGGGLYFWGLSKRTAPPDQNLRAQV